MATRQPTSIAPHPSSFPVGSPQSRAAVRAMLEARLSTAVRADVVLTVGVTEGKNVGSWTENADGSFSRRSTFPGGTERADIIAALAVPERAQAGNYSRIFVDI